MTIWQTYLNLIFKPMIVNGKRIQAWGADIDLLYIYKISILFYIICLSQLCNKLL